MFKISWTNSQGEKCKRQFERIEERVLFANMLYVNDTEEFGKISVARPTKKALDEAKAWAQKL